MVAHLFHKNMLPLFKSHYSINKSILTLGSPQEEKNLETPRSIFDIITENELKHFFLVEDSMSGFLQAYQEAKKLELSLSFGLRVSVHNTSPDSAFKIVIFCLNSQGYYDLIKIATFAGTVGKIGKIPAIDWENLEKLWTKNLKMGICFYDGFLHRNNTTFSACVPIFNFTEPIFFLEKHDLPFDELITTKTLQYCKNNDHQTIEVSSIYYETKEDFLAYQTIKAVSVMSRGKRGTLQRPENSHLSTDTFCWEDVKEKL